MGMSARDVPHRGRVLAAQQCDRSARPSMRDLMEATGETANLGIETSGMVLFLSQVETHESIRAFFPPGTLSPMHASGIGKALSGTFEGPRCAVFMAPSLTSLPPNTICTGGGFDGRSQADPARGFALDDEEKTLGMRCIAAPIFNHHGRGGGGHLRLRATHRVTADTVPKIGALGPKAAGDAVPRSLGAAITL